MRRVWTTRGMLPLVLLAAASLLFLGSGVHEASASAFQSTLTVALTNPAAGAVSDINETADWGTSPVTGTRAFPAGSVYYTPASWNIPNCAPGAGCPYANGERTGSFTSTTTFGLLNSQCAIPVPVAFPNGMKNASTDSSDSIAPGPAFVNLSSDVNPANGVQDGAEHWNDLLNNLIAAGVLPATPPRERQILHTNALGTEVWVDVLTYDPGLLPGSDPALGFATTFILENANPTQPPTPGLITDTCGLFNGVTQQGLAQGGAVHRSNPGGGTHKFALSSTSARDADSGHPTPTEPTIFILPGGLSGQGLVNNLDTCPFNPNHGSPLAPAGAPFNGDGAEAPGDGIDAVCDPNPDVFDGSDVDLDSYLNRGDNCPLVANGAGFGAGTNNQSDVLEIGAGPPGDGGPPNDGIGDSCDLHPTVADGHYHRSIKIVPVCVIDASHNDLDGDGYCDQDEVTLGCPVAAGCTPENTNDGTSCNDGVDNDGDGDIDLEDTGCQQPLHDNALTLDDAATSVNDPRNDCKSTNADQFRGLYKMKVQENTSNNQAEEPYQYGIYIDPVPGSGGFVGLPGTSVENVKDAGEPGVTFSGAVNFDGDPDLEWLTYGTRTGEKTLEVTVRFADLGCVPGQNRNPSNDNDYRISFDICHAGDPPPLGLSMLGQRNCDGTPTGSMDRENNPGPDGMPNTADDELCPGEGNGPHDPSVDCGPSNDATITVLVNDRGDPSVP